ncbi:uncharacterized protein [Ptychodera flava]|uniref:uncharacterized protein isoform X1 n=1 Tax=Ptychodera flava TaxID=63121 RepID=UPI00396A601A
MEITLSEDGKEFNMLFREQSACLLDAKGRLLLWKLMTLSNTMKYRTGPVVPFLPIPRAYYIGRAYTVTTSFVKAVEMKVHPAMYSKMRADSILAATLRLGYVRGSSSCLIDSAKLLESGELVYECAHLCVNVNKKTRRPIKNPDDFLKKVKQLQTGEEPTFMNPFRDVPSDGAFRYSFQAPHSDTDQNLHINQANFIKYCMDCAILGTQDQAYTLFKGDIGLYHVQSVSMVHLGEAAAGHRLEVISWEQAARPLELYFVIRRDEKDIFHCVIRFRNGISKL